MADAPATEAQALPGAPGDAPDTHVNAVTEHTEPMLLGVAPPTAIVSFAMIVLLVIAVWKGAHKMVTSGLDAKIADIKSQLEQARSLRAEAEALRKEYADKIAGAEKDAASMLDHARHEAEAIVAKAEADTTEAIARREKMAQDKIGAAERIAIADLRATAARAASDAAQGLIRSNFSSDADHALVERSIGAI